MSSTADVRDRVEHPRLAGISAAGLLLALVGGVAWGTGVVDSEAGKRILFLGGVVAFFGLTGLIAFSAFDPD